MVNRFENLDESDCVSNLFSRPVDRREAFGLTAGFALSLLAACRGETPEKRQFPAETIRKPAETAAGTPAMHGPLPSPEIPFDPNIPLPSFEFVDQPLPHEMPKGLEMSENEFLKLCEEIADRVMEGVEAFLRPRLSAAPGDPSPIFAEFVQRTAQLVELASPKSQEAMINFSNSWDNMPDSLVAEINKYLIPGGLYLQFSWGDGQISVSVLPVEKTAYVDVKDSFGQEKVPVIFAKPDLLLVGRSMRGEMGFSDSKFSHAVIFRGKAKPTSDDVRRKLADGGFVGFPGNFDQVMLTDFLTHETAHVFLAKRFPKKGAIRTIGHLFEVPLEIGIKNAAGEKIGLGGNYPPVVFHELAGVGIEIALGQSPVPYQIILHAMASDNPQTYLLVQKLLPLAILMIADDQNPKKKRLMDRLLNPATYGDLILPDVVEVLKDPEFTAGKTKKVGEIFYKLAYGVLKNMEEGKYSEVVVTP